MLCFKGQIIPLWNCSRTSCRLLREVWYWCACSWIEARSMTARSRWAAMAWSCSWRLSICTEAWRLNIENNNLCEDQNLHALKILELLLPTNAGWKYIIFKSLSVVKQNQSKWQWNGFSVCATFYLFRLVSGVISYWRNISQVLWYQWSRHITHTTLTRACYSVPSLPVAAGKSNRTADKLKLSCYLLSIQHGVRTWQQLFFRTS